jgi:pimeloyl-ACP methyl ester carboxylesterase
VTYLLIHGGGSTARFWDRLLPFLDGRPVLAVDLPGRNGKPTDFATLGVDEEVASVLADVDGADVQDPIVVVAHSSGGLVVPGVVSGLGARVEHVVLSAALVPTEGGCGIDCMKPRHREGLVASVEQARRDGTVITLPGSRCRARPPTRNRSAPRTAATRSTTRRSRTSSTPSGACPTPCTTISNRFGGRSPRTFR